ncbi:MAG: class I SAM-dependent RNA methyltransferase, partial [Erysipelotrichales bacterium]|nr:class I SAM-dependent RNA methyltransferase [Erysipelotrichales bacterium]
MLNKNEIIQETIIDITNEGYGVLKHDGFPVFVPYTVINEEVEIKVIKVAKSYAVGRVERILKDVDTRIEPKCPVYKKCGGCSLQHMTYDEELNIKQNYALETLKRIGKVNLDEVEVREIAGSDKVYHYRNKAEYPIQKDEDGKCRIGF